MMNDTNDYTNGQQSYRRPNSMATAAVVLGILSLILCYIFYLSIPCAALAIICALLSRNSRSISGRGKVGLICAAVGMILSLALTISAFYTTLFTEEGRASLQYYYQYYTGDTQTDINAVLDDLFPFLGGSSDDEEVPADDDTKAAPEDENDTGREDPAPQEPEPDQSSPNHSGGGEGTFI